jgi:hypothetical protein
MNLKAPSMRMSGTARGQTLFHVGDMLRFLDELAETPIERKTHEPRRKL